ncbi:MAG: hypothetical protein ACT4N1_01960, partial [Nitrososphaerota archaeon]
LISAILIGSVTSTSSADLTVLGNEHAPIYISDKDSGSFDFSNDGLTDYYVKAHYTGNEKEQYKVDYKIQDECVDGNTFDSATMKIGFTKMERPKWVWLVENIDVCNPWFRSARSADANHQIDLVDLPDGVQPIPYPSSGDDVIQGDSNKMGSFVHKDSIKELDNQPGWEGTIFFNAPAEEYLLFTVHPAGGIDGCDRLAALGIPIIIEPLK